MVVTCIGEIKEYVFLRFFYKMLPGITGVRVKVVGRKNE